MQLMEHNHNPVRETDTEGAIFKMKAASQWASWGLLIQAIWLRWTRFVMNILQIQYLVQQTCKHLATKSQTSGDFSEL